MKLIKGSLFVLAFALTLSSSIAQVYADFEPQLGHNPKPTTLGGGTSEFEPQLGHDPKPTTVGGGTRSDSCLKGDKEFTPLLPKNKLGLTLTGHPTFFWYMPESPARTAEFVLVTDEDKEYFKANLTIPEKPGILGFTLPKNTNSLAVGKTYHWYVTILCDQDDSSNNPHIDGFVEVTSADQKLSDTLANTNSLRLSNIYAQAGIWQEALNNLIQLRQEKPDEPIVQLHWQQLLKSKSVKLDNFIAEPFIDSVTTKN
jgi:hypothetical protein